VEPSEWNLQVTFGPFASKVAGIPSSVPKVRPESAVLTPSLSIIVKVSQFLSVAHCGSKLNFTVLAPTKSKVHSLSKLSA